MTPVETIVYLIRHAQDPDGFRGGWSDLGLTDAGIGQSHELSAFLEQQPIAFDTLLTSDLKRAQATAEIIGQRLGLQVTASAAWREMNNGELAGMPEREARERFPGLFFGSLVWDEAYPGGESPRRFAERIYDAFAALEADIDRGVIGPRVALVTHNGVITILSALVTGANWSNRDPGPGVPHTGVRALTRGVEGWRCLDVYPPQPGGV